MFKLEKFDQTFQIKDEKTRKLMNCPASPFGTLTTSCSTYQSYFDVFLGLCVGKSFLFKNFLLSN